MRRRLPPIKRRAVATSRSLKIVEDREDNVIDRGDIFRNCGKKMPKIVDPVGDVGKIYSCNYTLRKLSDQKLKSDR